MPGSLDPPPYTHIEIQIDVAKDIDINKADKASTWRAFIKSLLHAKLCTVHYSLEIFMQRKRIVFCSSEI